MMLSDSSARKSQRLNGGFDASNFVHQQDIGDGGLGASMNPAPTPREMGHQLAVQLLQAFGSNADPIGDASEALAHAQMWICDMRKTGRTGLGGSTLGAQGSLLPSTNFSTQVGVGGLLQQSLLNASALQQQNSLLNNLQAQQHYHAAAAASYMPMPDHGLGSGLSSMPSRGGDEGSKGGRIKTPVGVKFEDWKDRPSDFLREYGDPGAAQGDRRPPTPGVKGNWECKGCNNINFPRRTNCLRCHTARDEEAEKIVQDYVKGIIEQAQSR